MKQKRPLQELDIVQLERRLARLKKGREKVDVLLELAYRTRAHTLNKAVDMCNTALDIAESLRYQKAIVRGLRLLAIINYQMIGDIITAHQYAEQAVAAATALDDEDNKLEVRATLAEVLYLKGEISLALSMMLENLVSARELSNTLVEVATVSNIGTIYSRTGRNREAIPYFEDAIALCQQLQDDSRLATVYNNLGSAYHYLGEHERAAKYYYVSKDIRQQLGEQSNLASTLLNISRLYSTIADYDTALSTIREADLALRDSGNLRLSAGVKLLVGEIYGYLERRQDAIEQYRLALDAYNALGQSQRAAIVGQAIGELLVEVGNTDEGIALLEHYVQVARASNDTLWRGSALHSYGQGLLKAGNYAESTLVLQQALIDYGDEIEGKANLLISLARSFFHEGNFRAALENARAATALPLEKGSLSTEIASLEIISDVQEREGDFQSAFTTSKVLLQKRYELYNANTTHKINTLLVVFDVEQAKKEAEINRIKAEQLEKELEMKKNELSIMALHLVSKNEFLGELKEQINENIDNTNSLVKSMAQRIEANSSDEKDWQRFEQQFAVVNPHFSAKLMEQSANTLTPMELKICALIKTGLSSKEIASILFLSKRTVENHRYNIHKKLNLGDAKLPAYLMSV